MTTSQSESATREAAAALTGVETTARSIADAAVVAHGGTITVASEPGRGTQFEVLLSRATSEAASAAESL